MTEYRYLIADHDVVLDAYNDLETAIAETQEHRDVCDAHLLDAQTGEFIIAADWMPWK